jgi:hypothetical protein
MAQTVIIHSRAADGFRRGGRAHAAGRNEYPAADFTAEQLEAVKAEPLFSVEITGEPDPAPEPEAPAAGKKKAG